MRRKTRLPPICEISFAAIMLNLGLRPTRSKDRVVIKPWRWSLAASSPILPLSDANQQTVWAQKPTFAATHDVDGGAQEADMCDLQSRDKPAVWPKRIDMAPALKADIGSMRSLRQYATFFGSFTNEWIITELRVSAPRSADRGTYEAPLMQLHTDF